MSSTEWRCAVCAIFTSMRSDPRNGMWNMSRNWGEYTFQMITDAVFTGVVCCWCVTFQHESNMVLLWTTVYLLCVPFALFVALSSSRCHSKERYYPTRCDRDQPFKAVSKTCWNGPAWRGHKWECPPRSVLERPALSRSHLVSKWVFWHIRMVHICEFTTFVWVC